MKHCDQHRSHSGSLTQCAVMAVALAFLFLPGVSAIQAQTYTVLHNFDGGDDGGEPASGVTFDQQGRIYGTASLGGSHGYGLVYRIVHQGEGAVLSPIYNFHGGDGDTPYARVLFGPDGLLYGTTAFGGAGSDGTVFSLQPPATACETVLCPWVETVLHGFTGGADGGYPEFGDLSFDQAGNIYGTTESGGSSGDGVVFKLSRSGGGWTESVLWNFTGHGDGGGPYAGVIFDNAGNLYGTATFGGASNLGTVYELSPTQSGWTETTLYSFTNNDRGNPFGGLAMDANGDLFGLTGGGYGPGAAYELTLLNGSWSFTLLQSFTEEEGPLAAPTLDAQGNLYGPLPFGGEDGEGEIFKLTPSGNQWIYSAFYQFGSGSGGVEPDGAVTFDASGNMYGTTLVYGSGGLGTVWEITP